MIIIQESNPTATAVYDKLKETHQNLYYVTEHKKRSYYIDPDEYNLYLRPDPRYMNTDDKIKLKGDEEEESIMKPIKEERKMLEYTTPPVVKTHPVKTYSEPPKRTYVSPITTEMYYSWYNGVQKGTIQYNSFTAKPYLDYGKYLEEQRIQFAKRIEEQNRLARTRYSRMI